MMAKIKVTISGEVYEPNYPLSGLNILLYMVSDNLNEIEAQYKEDVKFPIVKRFNDEGNYIEVKLEEV